MPKSIFCSFLLLTIPLNFGWTAPDRESFAKEDRPVEGVPVDAFELGDANLTIESGATVQGALSAPVITVRPQATVSGNFQMALDLPRGLSTGPGRRR